MDMKVIGNTTYKKINNRWHSLSFCGYFWRECSDKVSIKVEGYIC